MGEYGVPRMVEYGVPGKAGCTLESGTWSVGVPVFFFFFYCGGGSMDGEVSGERR